MAAFRENQLLVIYPVHSCPQNSAEIGCTLSIDGGQIAGDECAPGRVGWWAWMAGCLMVLFRKLWKTTACVVTVSLSGIGQNLLKSLLLFRADRMFKPATHTIAIDSALKNSKWP